MLSPLKRPVTWRETVKHAPQSCFSHRRFNFYPEPYALEPGEAEVSKSRVLDERVDGAGHQLLLTAQDRIISNCIRYFVTYASDMRHAPQVMCCPAGQPVSLPA